MHEPLLLARPSPTLWHDNVKHLSVFTPLPTRNSASNSFPSDHGLMAMVFVSFMLRFADRLVATLAASLTVITTTPRIMVGAHWVSDVDMGSLAIALVALPRRLCTPIAIGAVSLLDRSLEATRQPPGTAAQALIERRPFMQHQRIMLFNTLGVILLFSWAWPHLMLWTDLDDQVFWFFNRFITPGHGFWIDVLALLNSRFFDLDSLAVMGLLFWRAICLDPRKERLRRWLGIGMTMLLTAGVLSLFTLEGIRYGHPSPTRFFEHAHHLTDIVSIPTKDSASNSFPGDHGLMLMVFAAFMLRFADSRIAWLSVAFVVVLSAPRIMVGAHWFSDVYMGSLSIALIILPWLLCTPLAAQLTERITRGSHRMQPH